MHGALRRKATRERVAARVRVGRPRHTRRRYDQWKFEFNGETEKDYRRRTPLNPAPERIRVSLFRSPEDLDGSSQFLA